jgi:predicted small lipoprotein YifL
MKSIFKISVIAASVALLAACGQRVEVPPAHVGKIMTKDGYQENTIPTSKFRLPFCIWYCDKLVLMDASDKAKQESLTIFIPEDKLNLDVVMQVTLSIDPRKAESLFSTIPPTESDGDVGLIPWDFIYSTYAKQIVLTETREYLSKYSIAEIAGSLEKVNGDLREALSKRIQERTPFTVRYAGITSIKYPAIITEAQENAAERRERIQQEEAQLQISKVTLERELQETRLRRQIELEKAQIEAKSQEIQRAVVDEKVLKLRQLENERAWIEKWDGALPQTVMGGDKAANVLMTMPTQGK